MGLHWIPQASSTLSLKEAFQTLLIS